MRATTPPVSERAADATRWAAELGAVTAEALAVRSQVSIASARGVLRAAERGGLVTGTRPLHHGATLYSATASGLRATDAQALGVARVSASNAAHLAAVALVAAALAASTPPTIASRASASCGATSVSPAGRSRAPASARRPTAGRCCTGPTSSCGPATRRQGGGPVVVEVELTIKAPPRLAAICRAWARCPLVDGVLYYAPPPVSRAVQRAIDAAQAGERVVVLPLARALRTE